MKTFAEFYRSRPNTINASPATLNINEAEYRAIQADAIEAAVEVVIKCESRFLAFAATCVTELRALKPGEGKV